MIRLFKFFLPHIIKHYLLICASFATILLLLNWVASLNDPYNLLHIIIIWSIFPIVCFFNSKCYLPSSMNWILHTPVKKTHIICAHSLINLFKIFLSIILSSILWNIFTTDSSIISFLKLVKGGIANNYHGIDSVTVVLVILSFLFGIIYGIFPNTRLKANKGEPTSLLAQIKNNKKSYLFGVLTLIYLALFLDDLIIFFPSFIVLSLIIAGGVTSIFIVTLNSVKLYFSPHLKFIVFLFLSTAILLSYGINIHLTFKYDRSNITLKLEDYQELRIFSHFYRKEMAQSLVADSSQLKMLRERDIRNFFYQIKDEGLFTYALKHWTNECEGNGATSCRIQGYLISARDGAIPLENLRKGCPRDEQSCLELFQHKSSTDSDKEFAKNLLDQVCNPAFPSKEISCATYMRELKKYKKR